MKNLRLFILLIILSNTASASVVFPYTNTKVDEIDFNYFRVNISSNSSFTPQQINDAINISGQKSGNIIIQKIDKIPSGYLIYGSLKYYNISKNKLFNPWFNISSIYRYNNQKPNGIRPLAMSLNISNNSAPFGNSTHINITCAKQNCTDLRFVKDNATILPYYRESNTSLNGSSYGIFWFNLSSNSSSGYQIYTGDYNLSDLSNDTATFPFSGGTANKWNITLLSSNAIFLGNNIIKLTGEGTNGKGIITNQSFTPPFIEEAYVTLPQLQNNFPLGLGNQISYLSGFEYYAHVGGFETTQISGVQNDFGLPTYRTNETLLKFVLKNNIAYEMYWDNIQRFPSPGTWNSSGQTKAFAIPYSNIMYIREFRIRQYSTETWPTWGVGKSYLTSQRLSSYQWIRG